MTEFTHRRQTQRRGTKRRPNNQLYALRLNAGLSRQALGDRIGLSAETIRLAELGYVPGPRAQFAIAREFKLTPLELWPLERQRALVA